MIRPIATQQIRFASHLSGGSTSNGRDSCGKRLGIKLFAGQSCHPGSILVRQRGNVYHSGENVTVGRDFTLHAKSYGTVKHEYDFVTRKTTIHVVTAVVDAEKRAEQQRHRYGQDLAMTLHGKPIIPRVLTMQRVL